MVFVQYYHKGTTGKLIPVCGDRGVVILDGRHKLSTLHYHAKSLNGVRRPHYPAYQIWRGDSFTRAKPITLIREVQK